MVVGCCKWFFVNENRSTQSYVIDRNDIKDRIAT